MLRRILSKSADQIRAEERTALDRLAAALGTFDAGADDVKTLAASARQLDELFLLVVAGEFNAGKSAFINALLGGRILEEGPTPTTTRIHVIQYGPEVTRTEVDGLIDTVAAPVELLREIRIVDTPGTNAIHREHEAITRDFVPRSDLVLFITSADRPFTESERAFLEAIRDWGKKIVLVLNKIDLLEKPEDLAKVLAFVSDSARKLLGFAPELFPLSGRQALRAKESNDETLLSTSRFPALEKYLVETLDEKERIRLKLGNPLGVAAHLVEKYLGVADARTALLADDVTTLDTLERQLALYKEDMAREFRFRLADVDTVLHELENRGTTFFDERLRLGKVFDLLNKEKTRNDFVREVVADVPKAIDRRVHEVIDWMVSSDLRQWQAILEHLAKRKVAHADKIVGDAGMGSFEIDRNRLLESVGRAAQRSVESFDHAAEAERIAESVKGAVANTALVEVGALGLGALLVHLAATAAADFTGIVAAGTVAALGFFILPSRREKAKRELRANIETLREKLMSSLTGQFDREIERSLHRIDEGVGPYSRFVRSERTHLAGTREELAQIDGVLTRLAVEVGKL
ncbi:MAG: dynamin family protein [Acidobacteriota bacterium]